MENNTQNTIDETIPSDPYERVQLFKTELAEQKQALENLIKRWGFDGNGYTEARMSIQKASWVLDDAKSLIGYIWALLK